MGTINGAGDANPSGLHGLVQIFQRVSVVHAFYPLCWCSVVIGIQIICLLRYPDQIQDLCVSLERLLVYVL